MTRGGAIKHLKLMQSGARNAIRYKKNDKEISEEERKEDIEIYQDQLEALKIAINSLEQEPKTDSITIPNNATNGDMIKAMFSYGYYGTNGNFMHVYGVGGNGCLSFTLDWWNAPYKSEVSE